MKAPFRFAVLSLSLLGLSACASMDEQSTSLAPGAEAVTSNEVYMARVEHMARQRGIEVIWINKPRPTRQEMLAKE